MCIQACGYKTKEMGACMERGISYTEFNHECGGWRWILTRGVGENGRITAGLSINACSVRQGRGAGRAMLH